MRGTPHLQSTALLQMISQSQHQMANASTAPASFTPQQSQHIKSLNAQLTNLQDIQRADWQKRTESIQLIQTIFDRVVQDQNLTELEQQALLLHFFQIVQVPLNTQLADLRSSVTRETINTLVYFARTFPSEFAHHSSKYFCGSENLLKLLNNGKKLISDMAHEGIIQILNSVCIPKVIEQLLVHFKNSKNSLVRFRIATYFEIILKRYDIDFLMKSQKALETEFLLKGIDDQAQDVRKQVRACWKVYHSVEEFQERVILLIKDMRGQTKKQLQQELAISTVPSQATNMPMAINSPAACEASNSGSAMLAQGRKSTLLPKPRNAPMIEHAALEHLVTPATVKPSQQTKRTQLMKATMNTYSNQIAKRSTSRDHASSSLSRSRQLGTGIQPRTSVVRPGAATSMGLRGPSQGLQHNHAASASLLSTQQQSALASSNLTTPAKQLVQHSHKNSLAGQQPHQMSTASDSTCRNQDNVNGNATALTHRGVKQVFADLMSNSAVAKDNREMAAAYGDNNFKATTARPRKRSMLKEPTNFSQAVNKHSYGQQSSNVTTSANEHDQSRSRNIITNKNNNSSFNSTLGGSVTQRDRLTAQTHRNQAVTARHVRLTLDKQRRSPEKSIGGGSRGLAPSASFSARPATGLIVPGFSKEAMNKIKQQSRLENSAQMTANDSNTKKTTQMASSLLRPSSISPRQPRGPASGRSHSNNSFHQNHHNQQMQAQALIASQLLNQDTSQNHDIQSVMLPTFQQQDNKPERVSGAPHTQMFSHRHVNATSGFNSKLLGSKKTTTTGRKRSPLLAPRSSRGTASNRYQLQPFIPYHNNGSNNLNFASSVLSGKQQMAAPLTSRKINNQNNHNFNQKINTLCTNVIRQDQLKESIQNAPQTSPVQYTEKDNYFNNSQSGIQTYNSTTSEMEKIIKLKDVQVLDYSNEKQKQHPSLQAQQLTAEMQNNAYEDSSATQLLNQWHQQRHAVTEVANDLHHNQHNDHNNMITCGIAVNDLAEEVEATEDDAASQKYRDLEDENEKDDNDSCDDSGIAEETNCQPTDGQSANMMFVHHNQTIGQSSVVIGGRGAAHQKNGSSNSFTVSHQGITKANDSKLHQTVANQPQNNHHLYSYSAPMLTEDNVHHNHHRNHLKDVDDFEILELNNDQNNLDDNQQNLKTNAAYHDDHQKHQQQYGGQLGQKMLNQQQAAKISLIDQSRRSIVTRQDESLQNNVINLTDNSVVLERSTILLPSKKASGPGASFQCHNFSAVIARKESRPRSTSQYHGYNRSHFEEPSHQQLIDSAVTFIQQEKMNCGNGAQGPRSSRSRSKLMRDKNCNMSATGQIMNKVSMIGGGCKSARLLYSPRAPYNNNPQKMNHSLINTAEGFLSNQRRRGSSPMKQQKSPMPNQKIRLNNILNLNNTVNRTEYNSASNAAVLNASNYNSERVNRDKVGFQSVGSGVKPGDRPTFNIEASLFPMGAKAGDDDAPQDAVSATLRIQNQTQNEPQSVVKVASNFKDVLASGDNHNKGNKRSGSDNLSEMIQMIEDPGQQSFWREHTNDVMLFLQDEVEAGYSDPNESQRQLYLVGRIMNSYRNQITHKLKGVFLERTFDLLRDSNVLKVHGRALSELLNGFRAKNYGWHWFINSIEKLHQNGETDDLLFVKALSIVQAHLKTMPDFDNDLIRLLLNKLLLPQFVHSSTLVRKQVVTAMAQLKLAIEVRLTAGCAQQQLTFEGLLDGQLNQGYLKLVQIYFERLNKEYAVSQHQEDWSESDLNFICPASVKAPPVAKSSTQKPAQPKRTITDEKSTRSGEISKQQSSTSTKDASHIRRNSKHNFGAQKKKM